MKNSIESLAPKVAVVSTVVAFMMTCLLTIHGYNTGLVATVLEQGEKSIHQREVTQRPEKVVITYDFGGVDVSQSRNSSFFPEIEDNVHLFEKAVTDAPHCPFTPEVGSVVIDFTRNGTATREELFLYANKEIEEAESFVRHEVDVGTYVVELASYNNAEVIENNYEQQWYLEFLNDEDDVVYTTQSTRDMYVGESEMIELVERGMVLDTAISHVRATHSAFPDMEPQTIAPLCARLSKVQTENNFVELERGEKNLFTASVFLQQATKQSGNHFLFALGMMLALLCAMGVFIGSTISRRY
ncbi:TPA: hypothetical protein DEP58_00945 [Patescibacteria group bacterium]|nr:MAG: hypothetical protein UU98_C0006G0003 [Parcubacteria group bacterium GW2011_GWD2_42_14]HCC04856.1 hypothetical protein [Patescibacteria group bacterium]